MKKQIKFKEAIGKELTGVYNPFAGSQLYLVFGEEFVLVSVDSDDCGDLIDYRNFDEKTQFNTGFAAGILTKEEEEVLGEECRKKSLDQMRRQYELLKKEFEKK
jgi:hypothetical protein